MPLMLTTFSGSTEEEIEESERTQRLRLRIRTQTKAAKEAEADSQKAWESPRQLAKRGDSDDGSDPVTPIVSKYNLRASTLTQRGPASVKRKVFVKNRKLVYGVRLSTDSPQIKTLSRGNRKNHSVKSKGTRKSTSSASAAPTVDDTVVPKSILSM
jgi:hypothetical protein